MISITSALRLCTLNTSRFLLNNARQNVPLYGQMAGVKTLEEQVGLPPKPKKPLTPYFRFMNQMRPVVMSENPKYSVLEAVKLISKKWETVDEKTRAKLMEEYKRDQRAYVELRAKYDSQISSEQRSELKQLKQERNELKERKALKKRIKALGRPKKPASAFLRYIIQQRVDTPQKPNETYREWHHSATERWSKLSDAQKEVYLKEARKEYELYRTAIAAWEEKMVSMGHIDVVRHEALLDPPEPKPRRSSATKSE